jgi:hypothetical protein
MVREGIMKKHKRRRKGVSICLGLQRLLQNTEVDRIAKTVCESYNGLIFLRSIDKNGTQLSNKHSTIFIKFLSLEHKKLTNSSS